MATETVELAAAYVQLVPSLKGVEGVIAKALGGSSGPVQEASRSLGQRIVSSISDAVTRSPKVAVAVGKSVASAMAEAALAGAAVGRVVASAMGDTARIVGVAMGDVGRIAKRTFVDLTPQWVKIGVVGWRPCGVLGSVVCRRRGPRPQPASVCPRSACRTVCGRRWGPPTPGWV